MIQMNSFYWLDAFKPISTIWIGASPELEIALYTVCFNVRRNEVCVEILEIFLVINFKLLDRVNCQCSRRATVDTQ